MTENARQANDSEHDIGRKPDQTPRDQIAKTLAAGAGVAGGLAFTASILGATAVSIAALCFALVMIAGLTYLTKRNLLILNWLIETSGDHWTRWHWIILLCPCALIPTSILLGWDTSRWALPLAAIFGATCGYALYRVVRYEAFWSEEAQAELETLQPRKKK